MSLFYFLSIISAFVIYSDVFHRRIRCVELRTCLFRCVFCRNLAKRVSFIQFLHYCCQRWSPWAAILLLTNSALILILSDSHRGCLIWVKFVELFRSKNLKASWMSFTCTLFSDKVRFFNQSKRALYGDKTSCRPIRSVVILVINKSRGRPILLTDRIGLHSVLSPLLIN